MIADTAMPVMNGPAAIRAVRGLTPGATLVPTGAVSIDGAPGKFTVRSTGGGSAAAVTRER